MNGFTTGAMADALGDRMALLLMGVIPAIVIVVILGTAKKLVLIGSQRYPLEPYGQPATGAA